MNLTGFKMKLSERKVEMKMKDSSFHLKNLIIKPILKCNANCAFCGQRFEHYNSSNQSKLSFEKWEKVINEAAFLGVNSVSISGGEPTLYNYLFRLIELCKKRSLKAHLKTNGFLINDEYADKLSVSGLESCTISIYSENSTIHDQIKKLKGSHISAIKAIEYLKKGGIKTNIQTVLTSNLMNDFDEYLTWIGKLGINSLFISYLEGNYSIWRPTVTEIKKFVLEMIPRCKRILKTILSEKSQLLLNMGLKNLDSLFQFDNVSYEDISKGFYNKADLDGCGRNHTMALILSNGEIHPCNAIEYFHEPIVGNLIDESLSEAWQSTTWEKVRLYGPGLCHLCPMNRHTFINFTEEDYEPSFYSPPNWMEY